MHKASILFLLAMIFGTSLYANPDSTVYRKNEVGLNLLPAIVIPSVSSNQRFDYNPIFGLYYKREFCKKNFLRFRFQYSPQFDIINRYSSSYSVPENDSMYYSYTRNFDSKPFMLQLNIGYERVKALKKVSFFYGADLYYNFGHHKVSTYSEKILTRNIFPPSPNAGSYSYIIEDKKYTSGFETKYQSAGALIHGGIRYPLSKRWLLSAQCGLDFNMFYLSNQKSTDTNGNTFASGFQGIYNPLTNFELFPLLNDISVVYSF
jgi:hypothetical protein